MSNPKSGGRYVASSAESEPVFVSGTGRKQSSDEKKAADKIAKPSKSK